MLPLCKFDLICCLLQPFICRLLFSEFFCGGFVDHQPAVLTVTGDNALSIGVMLLTLYLGALFLVQLYKKATMKKSGS